MQHCQTDVTPQLLTEEQITNYLTEIPKWNYIAESQKIFRKFTFENYYQTLAFINAAAWIVHQENHHPEIHLAYNNCTFFFTTHSAGGITLFDFICAAHIEQL